MLVFFGACGNGNGGVEDAGVLDAGLFDAMLVDAPLDAASVDAPADADAPDASEDAGHDDSGADSGVLVDAGADAADGAIDPVPGFGTIVGPCGRVPPEVDDVDPSFFVVRLDFEDDRYDLSDLELLTEGAQRLLSEENAGGSSQVSEAFAYEVLERCEGAMRLVEIETGIRYEPSTSKKTDLVAFFHENVGVSVTRAVSFPVDSPYPLSEAQRVVGDKLDSILESTANVTFPGWDKQILVVMAWDEASADRVREAWHGFTPERRADTIVYVVITDGDDGPVYNR